MKTKLYFARTILILLGIGMVNCEPNTYSACENFAEPIYGTITDLRDGQTYKTVKIGEHWWMAENLNWGTFFIDHSGQAIPANPKRCYNNLESNCEIYGGLYSAPAALFNDPCPEGWRLPTDEDWVALEQEIGIEDPLGSRLVTAESLDLLKDPEYFSGQGSNCSGFGVRASGNLYHNFYYDSLSFQNLGRSTSFVGRHMVEEEYLIGVLRYISDTVFSRSVIHDFEGRDKNYISIRCIKDE
jgi:uncharacterized protein (TIGR02145 family)